MLIIIDCLLYNNYLLINNVCQMMTYYKNKNILKMPNNKNLYH